MSRPQVLVIDDEPHVTILIELAGRTWGYDVVGARSIDEGKSVLAQHPEAKLLFLDVRLPDGSGLDLLEELRQTPQYKDLPIVILTGIGQDDVIEQVQGAGAQCMTKPFSPSKLGRMVANMLDIEPE